MCGGGGGGGGVILVYTCCGTIAFARHIIVGRLFK